MTNFILDILCIGAIVSAILVITSKNPVISVLFLISVFVNVAGYLVVIGVGFIGISYIIVYVGAIAILFLFVIIILNLQLAELSEIGKQYTQNLPLGIILGSVFVFELIEIISSSVYSFNKNIFYFIINSVNGLVLRVNNSNISNDIYYIFNSNISDINFQSFIEIQSIGQMIYTNGIICILLCSIILILSIVGPIILSIQSKNK